MRKAYFFGLRLEIILEVAGARLKSMTRPHWLERCSKIDSTVACQLRLKELALKTKVARSLTMNYCIETIIHAMAGS